MTLQSDTFDFVMAARKIAEAALAKEESIDRAVAGMQRIIGCLQETERVFETQQKNLPHFVAVEVDRKLDQTVRAATAEISLRFDATYEAAERARKSFDEASEHARQTSANAAKSLTNSFIRNALSCFAVGCVGMIIGVWICSRLFVPPSDILQRQREAQQAVEALATRGGRSVSSWCDNRMCVRTDESMKDNLWTGNHDPSVTYRIIYGY